MINFHAIKICFPFPDPTITYAPLDLVPCTSSAKRDQNRRACESLLLQEEMTQEVRRGINAWMYENTNPEDQVRDNATDD
jgi:hypothetical protein